MANIDYEECRKIGDSIHIQFTNGESWLIPLDDIVGDIEEQRQIAKLEIMLDVCKRDKDALRYQLEEAKRKAAEQSVHLTALRRGLALSILFNVILLVVVLVTIGGR